MIQLSATPKILVHAPNWVGDHAMAFPFYSALREVFPKGEFTLIGRAWVSDLSPDGFSEVISLDGKKIKTGDLSRLRAMHFDLGFTLSPSFRSAWLLRQLKITRRIGFSSDMRWLILTDPERYNRFEHRALAYLRLLNTFLPPSLLAEDLFVKYRGVQLKPATTSKQKFTRIVICPGSTAASKKYPVGHFIRVIENISAKIKNAQFVLLGAKIDQAECDAIAAHFTHSKIKVESLCAKTTLREAHAIIASSALCIANDSGLAHMTSLTSAPLVTFNGMGRREETAPLTHKKNLFDLKLECSPCFHRNCPRKDEPLACLMRISPESVTQAALSLI